MLPSCQSQHTPYHLSRLHLEEIFLTTGSAFPLGMQHLRPLQQHMPLREELRGLAETAAPLARLSALDAGLEAPEDAEEKALPLQCHSTLLYSPGASATSF